MEEVARRMERMLILLISCSLTLVCLPGSLEQDGGGCQKNGEDAGPAHQLQPNLGMLTWEPGGGWRSARRMERMLALLISCSLTLLCLPGSLEQDRGGCQKNGEDAGPTHQLQPNLGMLT